MLISRLLPLSLIALTACAPNPLPPDRWLEVATDAARWLDSAATSTDSGLVWVVSPTEPERVAVDLYTGGSGIVLFRLDLHAAGGGATALQQAVGGARELATALPDELVAQTGLMQGAAGIGRVLLQLRAVEAGLPGPQVLPDNPFARFGPVSGRR